MNRRISTLVLVAAALIAFQAGSAEAKAVKSPNVKNAVTTTKNNTTVLGGSGAAKNLNTTAINRLPPQKVEGTNFGTTLGGRPIGHGPVVPPKSNPITWGGNPPRAPTTPVTWGGNPPRAPTHGCGDHDGDCHHGECNGHQCSHNYYGSTLGRFCFDGFFGDFYGDCDGFYGDCGN